MCVYERVYFRILLTPLFVLFWVSPPPSSSLGALNKDAALISACVSRIICKTALTLAYRPETQTSSGISRNPCVSYYAQHPAWFLDDLKVLNIIFSHELMTRKSDKRKVQALNQNGDFPVSWWLQCNHNLLAGLLLVSGHEKADSPSAVQREEDSPSVARAQHVKPSADSSRP